MTIFYYQKLKQHITGVIVLFKKINLLILFIALLSYETISFADINLSGYGSIVAGRVISGDEFLSDYPNAGVYDSDISFSPDTSIGVQLIAGLDDSLEFVIQAVSNGATDYDIDLDWAYINYQLNTELTIQAGRKRLPLYYYSDFFNVGYAYYWIRPPADNYTWQISHYNGLSLQYQPYIGEWDVLLNLYAGREDSNDNKLLSFLSGVPVDETWKNMVGIVTEVSKDWLEFRATFMQGQLDRSVSGVVTAQNVKQRFSGISVNLYLYEFIILSEYNQYVREASDIHVDTRMLSLAYQLGAFTPHVTRSALHQKENKFGGDEDHNTISIGLRWDYNKKTAIKVQFDRVQDKGVAIPILENSDAVSIGVDFVF